MMISIVVASSSTTTTSSSANALRKSCRNILQSTRVIPSSSLTKTKTTTKVATTTTVCRSFAATSSNNETLVKTSLYDFHKELGGDMVPFAGYELPVLYKNTTNGGVMKEHLWCRTMNQSSLFDVSHMGQVKTIHRDILNFYFILFSSYFYLFFFYSTLIFFFSKFSYFFGI
jgi:Aminomethyltransferase folate-binding domain